MKGDKAPVNEKKPTTVEENKSAAMENKAVLKDNKEIINENKNVPANRDANKQPIRRSVSDSASDISTTSFKRWHKYLQAQHLRSKRPSFSTWKCCYKFCRPCRWFDGIEYDKKICKCCLRFRTFKSFGTIVLIGVFFYIYMFSILRKDVLPGGTTFFLFLLFSAAYISGFTIELIGLPPMLAHLIIGIAFEKIPMNSPLPRDNDIVEKIAIIAEKVLLVNALIRAGLLLDMSRIKNHVIFIVRLSFFPFSCEFLIVWVISHFMMKLPWDWSALQGSVMSVLSLASVTSVMEKNRKNGYGEDKHLSSVLIAAAVLNAVFGIFLYAMCITYVLPEGGKFQYGWKSLLHILKQIGLGLAVGFVSGFLIAFFPDKRNTEAAAIRILVIGVSSVAIGNVFYEFHMPAAGALACLTTCATAANMWEEIGWHKENNPVQYFYTMSYYFGQPVALSLVGYTMNFRADEKIEIGLSIAILIIGLIGREIMCFATASSATYPTTIKERLFICTAWLSKGTFQVLLAFAAKYILNKERAHFDKNTFEEYSIYARYIKQTTVIAILLTTPLACFSLTLLTPILLTKTESSLESRHSDEDQYRLKRRRTSIKFIGTYTTSQ